MHSIDDIYCELLKNSVASDKALWHIAMALSALPQNILDFALAYCAFITLDKDSRGLSVSSNDPHVMNREHLIFLPGWLWSEEALILAFVIARQIAYAHKQHSLKDATNKNRAVKEREADLQAIAWLSPRFPKSSFNNFVNQPK